jgi:hypothetical protein
MDEQKINNLITQGIETYMRNKQYTYSKIQAHEHNGTDTVRINENDLIPSDSFLAPIVLGSAGNEIFTIAGIPNLSLITLYGVATNGAYGGGPYAEKATITGEARIGKVYKMTTLNGSGDTLTATNGSIANFYQACNSMYVNTSDSTKMFTGASSSNIAILTSDGTTVAASITIIAITDSSVTLDVKVTSQWYFNCYLFLS